MKAQELDARLRLRGWYFYRIPMADLREALIATATGLGEIVRVRNGHSVEVLSPRSRDGARQASLSKRYGLSALPLHCDTAHWSVPCRYVVLGCEATGNVDAPTLLFDTHNLVESEKALARSAVFCVHNGRRSFYATMLDKWRPFLRIDPGCMEPTDLDGAQAMNLFASERVLGSSIKFDWTVGSILIIDNWRMLHGRGNEAEADTDRRLLRVYAR